MEAVFALAGGLIGFVSAIVSFTILETGLLLSLSIWSGVGILAWFGGLAFAMVLRNLPATAAKAQSV